ncbi:hypothetical protein L226DRAFT_524110 [Lentinus tigrinus ALCF2SS1-7]|uniref:DUF6533 domain-containing protein n=1 Tax=Lentinus tigrinus ALCF2SS1-6 TaxID=1328759 RepID=A0A5C2S5Q8_9APHY|nr:hypothetical protein L227DRAFT_564456 [Lentinus tigrinus ALCF2SS1-6]RPD73282.1 hypothetical protein L226DRAFT_524110 [Lentinus tigrinus ALCF2SS1-7]
MSSDQAAEAAAIVSLFDSLYTESFCGVAAAVLFLYSSVTTLDREVACFWSTKLTSSGSSLLFFANKAISTMVYIFALVAFASFHSDESCSAFRKAGYAVSFLQFVPWAVFSALRAYVLSKSKLLGVVVLVLSVAPLVANLIPIGMGSSLSGVTFPPFGCLESSNTTMGLDIKFVLHASVFSVLGLILTS